MIVGNCNLQHLNSKMLSEIKSFGSSKCQKQYLQFGGRSQNKAIWEVSKRTKVDAVPKLYFSCWKAKHRLKFRDIWLVFKLG